MSTKKTKRFEMVMSEEDLKRVKALADKWESSESQAVRVSVKHEYEREIEGKEK